MFTGQVVWGLSFAGSRSKPAKKRSHRVRLSKSYPEPDFLDALSSVGYVETASCIKNMAEIAAIPGVDILFLGQNDLCMPMGLYEKYEFPHMYTPPELNEATQTLVKEARKNHVILGVFLFGTSRVGEFLEKGFTFISIGNDLHHVLTQSTAYVQDLESIAKNKSKNWVRRPTALM